MSLSRTAVRVNERHLSDLKEVVEHLLATARDPPDEDGVWTTLLWATIDRQDRRALRSGATERRSR
jgi:hypothetical protein